jgi:hypothetical protein
VSNINDLIRRTSVMVDTSGRYPAPAIQTSVIQAVGGGVYPQSSGADGDSSENILVGRISLGIIAAFVAGAVGFYVWTNSIQGGG